MARLREVYTVSFDKSHISNRTFKILEETGLEFEEVDQGGGKIRIDMDETDFFNFEADCAERGVKLPVDGSNSWGKWV